MKKLLTSALSLILFLSLCACSSTPSSESSSMSPAEDDKVTIGVLQLLTHDALDSSYEGFKELLAEKGLTEGEDLELIFQNPEGDQSNLATMADALVAKDPDLIFVIATSPAQAVLQSLESAGKSIPVIGTAITSFTEVGLADSDEVPGKGISGVSDNCSMQLQLQLAQQVVPELKTLGILYTSSEANSEIQAQQMQAACAAAGVEAFVKTVSDKTMIDDTMQSFVGNIDALYIPTDNNIAAAMGSVDITAREHQIPVIASEAGMCANGGLVSLGVDYHLIGRMAGEMALEVLNGADVNTMPIRYDTTGTVYYNSVTAADIGLTLPESITSVGVDVAEK
ncbi:MAG: ABC transporter substrate-binding protein [Erysipelotrichaceae bacterium]|nr:ABC transporter substrate-binding protein [Erysipelotrichaceae bacterium]